MIIIGITQDKSKNVKLKLDFNNLGNINKSIAFAY